LDGKPSEVGSKPTLGMLCPSFMRVKFRRMFDYVGGVQGDDFVGRHAQITAIQQRPLGDVVEIVVLALSVIGMAHIREETACGSSCC